MKKNASQYTIRNIPKSVDMALRKRAKEEEKSLNTLLLEALQSAAGVYGDVVEFHDLDSFAGSWIDDKAVDKALKDQRKFDPKDWK